MIFKPHTCPQCKVPAEGVCETVPGLSLLIFNGSEADYAGETKMDWDNQTQLTDSRGRVTLQCPSGHRWKATQR